MLSDSIQREIINYLRPLEPERVILFGSYAYGTPTEDSDLDICIVKKDYKNKWEEKAKIRDLLDVIKIPIDILNPKVDEYNFYKTLFTRILMKKDWFYGILKTI